ncbi:MAG TPA: aldehyde dehydrogenase family protein [Acidimicrobiales bacterium]|nr:aldehyde dehydrogenase family protein [Acidimicrobiales bacterium]
MNTELDVINPATEEKIASVAIHDLDETNRAIERASSVAPAWRRVTPADRSRLLRRFADVVDAHLEELAQLEVANSGHTISNDRWEAGNVRDVLMYYSGALSVNSNYSVRYSTPFGGFKQSGLGRELGPDALLGFS